MADVVIRLAVENGQVKVKLDEAQRQFQRLGGAANSAFSGARAQAGVLGTAIGGISVQVLSLVTAYKALSAAMDVVKLADDYSLLVAKLKLVTNGTGELQAAQRGVFAIAQATGQALTSTAELYGRLARSTREYGSTQGQILAATETITKAIAVSGAGAREADAALIQLSQGLASGKLAGDELRSVLEQAPRLGKAIADGLGIPYAKLRQFAKEGRLTTEAVFGALINQSQKVDSEFSKLPVTFARGMQRVKNSFEQTMGSIALDSGFTKVLGEGLTQLSLDMDRTLKILIGGVKIVVSLLVVQFVQAMTRSAGAALELKAALEAEAVAAREAYFVMRDQLAQAAAMAKLTLDRTKATLLESQAILARGAAWQIAAVQAAEANLITARAERVRATQALATAETMRYYAVTAADVVMWDNEVALAAARAANAVRLQGVATAELATATKALNTVSPEMAAALATEAKLANDAALAVNNLAIAQGRVAAQIGVAATGVLASIGAFLGLTGTVTLARVAVGLLGAAFQALFAGVIGWQIGKYLASEFEWARNAGTRLVNGLVGSWILISTAWDNMIDRMHTGWEGFKNFVLIPFDPLRWWAKSLDDADAALKRRIDARNEKAKADLLALGAGMAFTRGLPVDANAPQPRGDKPAVTPFGTGLGKAVASASAKAAAEIETLKAAYAAANEELDAGLKKHQFSEEAYFAARRELITNQTSAEVEEYRRALAAKDNSVEEQGKLAANLSAAYSDERKKNALLDQEQEDHELKIYENRIKLQTDILKEAGQAETAAQIESLDKLAKIADSAGMDESATKLREKIKAILVRVGLDIDDAHLAERLFSSAGLAAAYSEIQARIDLIKNAFARGQTGVQARVAAGLSPEAAAAEMMKLESDSAKELYVELKKLQDLQRENPDNVQLKDRVSATTRDLADMVKTVSPQVENMVQSLDAGLSGFLNNMATGAKSVGQAFRDMLRQIASDLQGALIKKLIENLFSSVLKPYGMKYEGGSLLQLAIGAVGAVAGAAGSGTAGGAQAFRGPPGRTGGKVLGPGGPTDDKVLARLSNGEFVLRAAAVNDLGTDLLHQMNAGGRRGLAQALGTLRSPGFAEGGYVGSSPMFQVGYANPASPGAAVNIGPTHIDARGADGSAVVAIMRGVDARMMALKKDIFETMRRGIPT